ncbi:phosphate-starvation-inducible protein PsiE [Marinobacter psychrophilus]|jgi:protein PsiE|uniref:phosphate-starvation-inducible protein PsiE n=1 Tax=Marinobacter psychrophilus TaxID=330734 RepID=UPI001B5274BA|nr:phosphate-starvation-inducible PsiE family protein [Marinobacter psychrophilus]MBQ0762906.1 phosphate-starvation-inducible PsiE family protein [Marinobacter psychrophilus]MBQ0846156.1 phosphate-starvation-inducible PsiE family protein [Marinobacter psychrophilus]
MSTKRNTDCSQNSEAQSTASGSDDVSGGDSGKKTFALATFKVIENLLLIIVVLMTLGGVAFELLAIYSVQKISLADILLIFLYLEVIGMVAVFYSDRRSAFVYPIFIAITALARLIILQGKDMAPENILYEAIAILILALSAIVIIRLNRI